MFEMRVFSEVPSLCSCRVAALCLKEKAGTVVAPDPPGLNEYRHKYWTPHTALVRRGLERVDVSKVEKGRAK